MMMKMVKTAVNPQMTPMLRQTCPEVYSYLVRSQSEPSTEEEPGVPPVMVQPW